MKLKLTGDITHLMIVEDRFTAFVTCHIGSIYLVVIFARDRASQRESDACIIRSADWANI